MWFLPPSPGTLPLGYIPVATSLLLTPSTSLAWSSTVLLYPHNWSPCFWPLSAPAHSLPSYQNSLSEIKPWSYYFQLRNLPWLFTVHSTSPQYLRFTCPSVPSLSSSTLRAWPVLVRVRTSFPTFASTLTCLLNHTRNLWNTSAAGRLACTLRFTRLHFADTLLYRSRSVATLLSACLSPSVFQQRLLSFTSDSIQILNPPSAKNN